MPRKVVPALALLGAITSLLLLLAAAPALAASGGTSSIGQNLGNEITSWGKNLLFAVTAIVGLPALFKRKVDEALIVVVIAVLVGGFIYASSSVQHVITSLWTAIGGCVGDGRQQHDGDPELPRVLPD